MEERSNIIQRDFTIGNVSSTEVDGVKSYLFEISNESVDSHGTIIKKDAWRLERYMSNPIVTIGHPDMNTTDLDVIVGRSEIFFEGSKMFGRYIPEPGNPKADMVIRKIENGTLNMASVRGFAYDGRYGIKEKGEDPNIFHWTDMELLDWGILMHGSNPGAVKKSIERAIKNITESKKQEDYTPDQGVLNSIEAARHITDYLTKKLQR